MYKRVSATSPNHFSPMTQLTQFKICDFLFKIPLEFIYYTDESHFEA